MIIYETNSSIAGKYAEVNRMIIWYGEYFSESMTLWRFPRFPFCHGAPNHPVVTDETTMLMTGDLHDF
jgi:hypothetical protein